MSRRNVHIRRLRPTPEDQQKCAAALTGRYGADDEFLTYPATTILVAEDGQNSVYMPVQRVYFMDTMGYIDGTPDLALAKAMKQFVSILVWEGRNTGQGELWFVGNNEATNEFALNNGFEEVEYKVFRFRHGQEATPLAADKKEGSSNGVEQQ